MSEAAKNVYGLIAAVSEEVARTGIAKDQKNAQQGYAFRGIDSVYNALAPIISKHKLVILPRFISRECVERQTKNGGVLFSTVVEAEFDFVSAFDGSKHTVRTFGEAMDSADKSSSKAMSAAYKYAAFQTFCIPTEGDNDADATHHEVESQAPAEQPRQAPQQPRQATPPEQRSQDNGHGSDLLISDAQRKRLYAIGKNHGWEDEVMKAWLESEWGYHSSKDIRRKDYDAICKAVEGRG